MRLVGKVNSIKRIIARARRGAVEDEKRVYSLNIRLPDKSLTAEYNYGYGNMDFILHGQAMEDFVDLGGEVDVYVVKRGEGEVPDRVVEDLRSRAYELEGDVASLTATAETLKSRHEEVQNANTTLHQRLSVAMNEVMRLEARMGAMPDAPTPQIEHQGN